MYTQPPENEKRRAKGIYAYDPRKNNPKIPRELLCNTVINLKEFIDWASLPENNVNGYVFIDYREKNGMMTQELNEWRYKNGLKPSYEKHSKAYIERINKEAEEEGFELPK